MITAIILTIVIAVAIFFIFRAINARYFKRRQFISPVLAVCGALAVIATIYGGITFIIMSSANPAKDTERVLTVDSVTIYFDAESNEYFKVRPNLWSLTKMFERDVLDYDTVDDAVTAFETYESYAEKIFPGESNEE